ncbi:MAG: alpha/beta hydrolase [Pseudorhodobacter sp.]
MILRKLAASLTIAAAVLGGAVFTGWRLNAVETASEASYPPLGELLSVDGLQVHALVKGRGPDLVLIHGAGGNLRDFDLDLIERLTSKYRVIAFDRPGLGHSTAIANGQDIRAQARHLQAAADQIGVKNPIVLGHSFGGGVAMGWALNRPETTRALVILAGATMPFPGDVDRWYHLTGGPFSALLNPAITLLASPSRVQASLLSTFAPDPVAPGYATHIGAGLTTRRKTLAENGKQVLALKENLAAMSQGYANLTLPVEILHGSADTTVRPEVHAIPLSQILPNARVTLIEGAGHMPHHSHAQTVVEAIDRAALR